MSLPTDDLPGRTVNGSDPASNVIGTPLGGQNMLIRSKAWPCPARNGRGGPRPDLGIYESTSSIGLTGSRPQHSLTALPRGGLRHVALARRHYLAVALGHRIGASTILRSPTRPTCVPPDHRRSRPNRGRQRTLPPPEQAADGPASRSPTIDQPTARRRRQTRPRSPPDANRPEPCPTAPNEHQVWEQPVDNISCPGTPCSQFAPNAAHSPRIVDHEKINNDIDTGPDLLELAEGSQNRESGAEGIRTPDPLTASQARQVR